MGSRTDGSPEPAEVGGAIVRASRGLVPGVFELHEEVIARRRAAGTQPWYVNIGLASPAVPGTAADE